MGVSASELLMNAFPGFAPDRMTVSLFILHSHNLLHSPPSMSSSRDRVEDTYESQNDQRLDELHAKVRTLRGVSCLASYATLYPGLTTITRSPQTLMTMLNVKI